MTQTSKTKELEDALKDMVRIGLLVKTKKGYIDSEHSREIDKMNSRESYLVGRQEARKELQLKIDKLMNERGRMAKLLFEKGVTSW